ncbi:MAG: CBS domain-containing protein [Candidatus Binatia bacterium]
MLVGNRMTKEPMIIGPDAVFREAQEKMRRGGFRRLPVVSDNKLIGIVTERDLISHIGHLDRTKINGVMNENVRTIGPAAALEEAALILLKFQIGGLPVVDNEQLGGIVTASDVMKAFLDTMGASQPASTRLDFILEGEEHGIVEASRVVSREGGEILGIGTYREKIGENPVCYLRLVSGNAERIADGLRRSGFNVLGVHRLCGIDV